MQIEIIGRVNYIETKEIETIYFGGGTPSILSITEIQGLLNTVYKHYSVNKDAEITLECNPDDLNKEKLISLKKIGINRLSIGVQSFNDKDLKFMRRSHNSKEAINCIHLAKKVGFENITIDLIYGIPNQTLNAWNKNIDLMLNLDIPHFSAYALTIEPKTELNHLVRNKKAQVLSGEKIIEQFKLIQEKALKSGFVHYEISNFGKDGFFSIHNAAYWKNKHYLGIGPSSHSYNRYSRRWNVSSHKKYITGLTNNSEYFETETLNKEQQHNEYVFTTLRTIWGIDLKLVKDRFGIKMCQKLQTRAEKWKKTEDLKQKKDFIKLTNKGKLFADAIASDLFIV